MNYIRLITTLFIISAFSPRLYSQATLISGSKTSTLNSYTPPEGKNRVIVVGVGDENINNIGTVTSVTWAGQNLTLAVAQTGLGDNENDRQIEIWYLSEAGIQATGTCSGDFVVTWSVGPNAQLFSAITIQHVDQSSIVAATSSNAIASGAGKTIQLTPGVATGVNDLVYYLASTARASTNHTAPGDYTEINDLNNASHTMADAYKEIVSAATENPIATFGLKARTEIAGVTFNGNTEPTTYYSIATGNWEDNTTWSFISSGGPAIPVGDFPARTDNVVIRDGHLVTVDAMNDNGFCPTSPDGLGRANVGTFPGSDVNMFYHTGDIIVDFGGTFSVTLPSMYEGFTYINGTFTSTADIINLGNMEVTSAATFSSGDDVILTGNSLTTFNNTTTSNDDLYMDWTDALLCGSGVLNVGNGGPDPIVQYLNGATEAQICSSITINCTSNCGVGPFVAPSNPGSFTLGYTGPGGIGGTDGTTELILWLNANTIAQGTGTNLSTWSDQSGYGNDATTPGGSEPVFNASQLNGFPAIQFTKANSDYMQISHDASLAPSTISMFIVGNIESGSDIAAAYFCKVNNPLGPVAGYAILRVLTTEQSFSIINNSGIIGTTTYGVYNIMGATYDDPGMEYWVNETPQGTNTSAGGIGANTNVAYVGALVDMAGTAPGYFLEGDIGEIILINRAVNEAERIIIDNYLSAKYAISLSGNDVYEQDDNGDFDFEVAGIGQAIDGTFKKDSQGIGLVRINLASNLDNDEFLMWGHNGTDINTVNTTDVDGTLIEARLERSWRVSENNNTGSAVDVGTVQLTFDVRNLLLSLFGSDIRLLITRDDAFFADNDIAPLAGSYNIDNQLVTFSNVDFQDGDYFTLGTVDNINSPLPIELVSFEAETKNEFVKLLWITASELNNDYFTIERSENVIKWERVITVDGKGITGSQNEYWTVDYQPYTGVSYYRLKQTDFDGTFSYSEIVSVKVDTSGRVSIYPNPSKGSFHIIAGFDLSNSEVRIFDLSGRLHKSRVEFKEFSGEIYLVQPQKGMYMLELRDHFRVYKQKILVD